VFINHLIKNPFSIFILIFNIHFNLIASNNLTNNYCQNYNSLSSNDRQLISDVRFSLESINLNQNESSFIKILNQILAKPSALYVKNIMNDQYQGLLAEVFFRQLVHKTIQLNHLAYKEFKIFIDLIVYNRAMDNHGFVNETEFGKSRKRLEQVIIEFFNEKEKPLVDLVKSKRNEIVPLLTKNSPIDISFKEKAQKFVELENQKAQMLGSIEIIWKQLLKRNQQNKEETMAINAILDLTVNTAIAIAGFTVAATTSISANSISTFLNSSDALLNYTVTAVAACGVGLVSRYSFEQVTASYLDISKALIRSTQNKTKFACELGQQVNNSLDDEKLSAIAIPDERDPLTIKDYILTCALSSASALSPAVVGVGLDALMASYFTNSAYNLVKETVILMEEIPHLEELKSKARSSNVSPEELTVLENKIKESEAKVILYKMAAGNSALNAFRIGFLLSLDKKNIVKTINKALPYLFKNKQIPYTSEELLIFKTSEMIQKVSTRN